MKISDWIFSILAGAIFIIISVWSIELPGLQYDESLCAAPAVNFVVDNPKSEPTQINPSVIKIFGRPFPLMLMTYIGPIKTLLYIPIFWLFDISALTVRLLPLLVMFFCFPVIFYICKKVFDKEVAIFVVLLMSVDPSIVFYLTRDVGPAALQVFFKLFALLFFIKWWDTKKDLFFYIATFILGLGVTHKADFLWVIVGLVIPFVILAFKNLKMRFNKKNIIFGALHFATGAFPILLFNIYTGGYTFSPVTSKFLSDEPNNNTSFINNLLTRIHQIVEIHNGNFIASLFSETNVFDGYWQYFQAIIFLLCLSYILINLFLKSKPKYFINVLGLVLFIIIVTIETCFSPTELSGHHILALTPFIIVFIVYSILSMKFLKRYLKYLILFSVFVYLSYSSISINKILKETGGAGHWSNSIYELNNYLTKENKTVGVLDWGYTNNLIVLSKGNLKIDRLYTSVWKNIDIKDFLKETINDTTIYIAYVDRYSTFPVVKNTFFDVANEMGYKIILEKEFQQNNGEVLHLVYKLKKI